ncbi:MAG: hypothetical protein JJE50_01555 [Actinomycetales bacterium]|nr:hypothetical protein [Actinomycetales bacterium]
MSTDETREALTAAVREGEAAGMYADDASSRVLVVGAFRASWDEDVLLGRVLRWQRDRGMTPDADDDREAVRAVLDIQRPLALLDVLAARDAEVERLTEAASVAEQYAGIAHEQRDEARAALVALREAVEGLDLDVLEDVAFDLGHTVYEATESEPAECTDECPACAIEDTVARLRAALAAAPSETETGR